MKRVRDSSEERRIPENLASLSAPCLAAHAGERSTLYVYTDGSVAKGESPPRMGSGVVFVWNDKIGFFGRTVNRRSVLARLGILNPNAPFSNPTTEILAVIYAFEKMAAFLDLCRAKKIVVMADFCQVEQYGNGKFKRPAHKPQSPTFVYQKTVCQMLDLVVKTRTRGITVDFKWIRGHDGNPGNVLADRMANGGDSAVSTVDAFIEEIKEDAERIPTKQARTAEVLQRTQAPSAPS